MYWVISFLFRAINFISEVICAVLALLQPSKQRFLKPIRNDLLLKPAVELADLIKSGSLKSEDLIKEYIARVKEVNPDLNAMIDDNFEEALKEAKLVDERVQRELGGNRKPGEKSIQEYPFLGVPFTAKDSIGVKGKSLTGGLAVRKDVKAEMDCEAVKRMKEIGGAIFLGVTNVPELLLSGSCFNRVYGQTNNPYDKSRVPGGSSGGEGSLLGAGASVIGIGSDLGGSIRIPASYCGIFGHKTTPNVVHTDGIYPKVYPVELLSMLSIGPMCRYVSDLRPMLKVLAGGELKLDDKPVDFQDLSVYFMHSIDEPFASPLDIEVKEIVDKVVKFLHSKGSRTFQLDTDNRFANIHYGCNIFASTLFPKFSSLAEGLHENQHKKFCPFLELIKCMVGVNGKYTAINLLMCIYQKLGIFDLNKEERIQMGEQLKKDFNKLLDEQTVLICPSLPESAPKHNQVILKTYNLTYTAIWNVLNVAVTSVPMGLDQKGLPISVQVIARAKNDNLTIQVAEALENEFGGWIPPCAIVKSRFN